MTTQIHTERAAAVAQVAAIVRAWADAAEAAGCVVNDVVGFQAEFIGAVSDGMRGVIDRALAARRRSLEEQAAELQGKINALPDHNTDAHPFADSARHDLGRRLAAVRRLITKHDARVKACDDMRG